MGSWLSAPKRASARTLTFAVKIELMQRFLSMLMVGVMVVVLCSCANERVFYKGNTICTASNRRAETWEYYRIELGTPSHPYVGMPALRIRSTDGAEFRTDQITVTNVLAIKNIHNTPLWVLNSSSPPFEPWPSGTEAYETGSTKFFITSNRIVHIMLVHTGQFQVVGDKIWHSLPCTESDIMSVLGKPDKVYEWFRE